MNDPPLLVIRGTIARPPLPINLDHDQSFDPVELSAKSRERVWQLTRLQKISRIRPACKLIEIGTNAAQAGYDSRVKRARCRTRDGDSAGLLRGRQERRTKQGGRR
ncbi:MAG: hypothetical protein WAP57_08455 [Aquabacterium commune]